MDPARRAMIEGWQSPPKRDVTSAKFDPSRRVTKPARPDHGTTRNNKDPRYLTQDEQERRFVADEDKFVLRQSKKKAAIRVREGRAKPIDYLAFNLGYIDEERDVLDDEEADVDIDVPAPSSVVQDLVQTAAELAELEAEMESYYVLETNGRNRDYWKALKALCATQRAKLEPVGRGSKNEERVVSSVSDDIDRILAPKSYDQLEALEGQIKAKLRSDEDIDIDYWEQLLRSLAVWKAKAMLAKVYDAIAEERQKRLEKRGGSGSGGGARPAAATPTASAAAPRTGSQGQEKEKEQEQEQEQEPEQEKQEQGPKQPSDAAARPRNEPPPPGTARFSQMEEGGDGQGDSSSQLATTDALYHREAARGVSENEEVFTAEEAVPGARRPAWAEQHRPRKPRYFNRVQMGYEWNKYNQTHYDYSNPPPKVVQGYRFNIFYPELIDKTKAPTFKIIREHGRRRGESFAAAGETDTCLIRFIAGPPYEDIAFRIVDREWDYSSKRERGFKSSFDKIFYRK
ncbi:Cactus-binding C-terminus of cactin protein [Geosmithia morbida]|uniref:Splicing factor Cactin n=1 Tax=Geosmithia morbida TaxID=1094350 RepID=A0A9P4Z1N1_9HYPO|nr:Cactus-binding C-terminus of cactin protein [Geosmithia morbida]KAF4124994.1 Cactus-binding C-terminus of cactin protein [Geosmithia morbida]